MSTGPPYLLPGLRLPARICCRMSSAICRITESEIVESYGVARSTARSHARGAAGRGPDLYRAAAGQVRARHAHWKLAVRVLPPAMRTVLCPGLTDILAGCVCVSRMHEGCA